MTSIATLDTQPLSAEAFAMFGDVIEVIEGADAQVINDGFTLRYNDLARVDVDAMGGRPLINIFRSSPLATPVIISKMERHPLSSQAFIPLGPHPYLVVVAPAGEFRAEDVRAFVAASHQGVNYYRGTWHHYCLALIADSDFLVIDRGATNPPDNENYDEVVLPEALQLVYKVM